MAIVKNIFNEKFGRLWVESYAGINSNGYATWKCLCECGQYVTVTGVHLRNGNTKSCGCITLKHGKTYSPEYTPWVQMRQRCYNTGHKDYPNYGARGITVTKKWHDFSSFLRDMGVRPTMKHTLERINNEGNYEPGNCKWALPAEQARNRRSTRYYEFKGERLCITDWAKKYQVHRTAIALRIEKGTPLDKPYKSHGKIRARLVIED